MGDVFLALWRKSFLISSATAKRNDQHFSLFRGQIHARKDRGRKQGAAEGQARGGAQEFPAAGGNLAGDAARAGHGFSDFSAGEFFAE